MTLRAALWFLTLVIGAAIASEAPLPASLPVSLTASLEDAFDLIQQLREYAELRHFAEKLDRPLRPEQCRPLNVGTLLFVSEMNWNAARRNLKGLKPLDLHDAIQHAALCTWAVTELLKTNESATKGFQFVSVIVHCSLGK